MMEIVKLKDAKFGTPKAYTRVTGYALKNEEGYITFPGDVLGYGIRIPYMPRGGKAALQEILMSMDSKSSVKCREIILVFQE